MIAPCGRDCIFIEDSHLHSAETASCRSPPSAGLDAADDVMVPAQRTDIREPSVADAANDVWALSWAPSIDEPSVLPCYTDAADSATVRPCELAHHGPSYTTLCHADAAKVPSSVPRMRLRGGGALESKTSCRVRAVSGEPLALVGGSSDTVLCRSPLSARSGAAVGAVGPGRCTDIRESPVADAANDMWSSALGPDIYEPSPLPDYGGAADNATTRSLMPASGLGDVDLGRTPLSLMCSGHMTVAGSFIGLGVLATPNAQLRVALVAAYFSRVWLCCGPALLTPDPEVTRLAEWLVVQRVLDWLSSLALPRCGVRLRTRGGDDLYLADERAGLVISEVTGDAAVWLIDVEYRLFSVQRFVFTKATTVAKLFQRICDRMQLQLRDIWGILGSRPLTLWNNCGDSLVSHGAVHGSHLRIQTRETRGGSRDARSVRARLALRSSPTRVVIHKTAPRALNMRPTPTRRERSLCCHCRCRHRQMPTSGVIYRVS